MGIDSRLKRLEVDALSLSIYEFINDEIKTGVFRALVEEMNNGK